MNPEHNVSLRSLRDDSVAGTDHGRSSAQRLSFAGSTVELEEAGTSLASGSIDQIRTGTPLYKYTTHGTSLKHRWHTRLFQVKGEGASTALTWRRDSMIDFRKERAVLFAHMSELRFGQHNISTQHPGYNGKSQAWCFTVVYTVPPSPEKCYLYLCAKTDLEFKMWKRGLRALYDRSAPHRDALLLHDLGSPRSEGQAWHGSVGGGGGEGGAQSSTARTSPAASASLQRSPNTEDKSQPRSHSSQHPSPADNLRDSGPPNHLPPPVPDAALLAQRRTSRTDTFGARTPLVQEKRASKAPSTVSAEGSSKDDKDLDLRRSRDGLSAEAKEKEKEKEKADVVTSAINTLPPPPERSPLPLLSAADKMAALERRFSYSAGGTKGSPAMSGASLSPRNTGGTGGGAGGRAGGDSPKALPHSAVGSKDTSRVTSRQNSFLHLDELGRDIPASEPDSERRDRNFGQQRRLRDMQDHGWKLHQKKVAEIMREYKAEWKDRQATLLSKLDTKEAELEAELKEVEDLTGELSSLDLLKAKIRQRSLELSHTIKRLNDLVKEREFATGRDAPGRPHRKPHKLQETLAEADKLLNGNKTGLRKISDTRTTIDRQLDMVPIPGPPSRLAALAWSCLHLLLLATLLFLFAFLPLRALTHWMPHSAWLRLPRPSPDSLLVRHLCPANPRPCPPWLRRPLAALCSTLKPSPPPFTLWSPPSPWDALAAPFLHGREARSQAKLEQALARNGEAVPECGGAGCRGVEGNWARCSQLARIGYPYSAHWWL